MVKKQLLVHIRIFGLKLYYFNFLKKLIYVKITTNL